MSAPSTDRAGVVRVIRAMKKAGAEPRVLFNGEEKFRVVGLGEKALLSRMFATDSDVVAWTLDGARLSVHFVYGNSGAEVVANYWPVDSQLADVLDREIEKWE